MMQKLYVHMLGTIVATFSGVVPTGRHAQIHPGKLPLIPAPSARDAGRLVVVLDMDETLLHSSLTPLPLGADPCSVDDQMDALAAQKFKQGSRKMKETPDYRFTAGEGEEDQTRVRTTLRPGLREFLLAVSAEFEPILFTASKVEYARPLLDLVEGPGPGRASVTVPGDASVPKELHPLFRHRLYREATVHSPEIDYDRVKDLRLLGRDMRRIILIED
jgi:TFIIF-interacting CTD phosphatase-like protein